ncbi:glycosyltransferase family 2 protein [Neolewinella antarctica]|uniref:Glycosyltransferase involved in cell wall biosynthesis n=1 Tax=Neolewinella antarctica TaxID=442734 RepID=A0ABX0X6Z2_9BACT|nr:glycosyltransferase family 2 protein [Neolewinella antarctica]NJC24983.1 glycosyltransferase involved in cell wall biosynthesis [Neolewinella antarctica]
MHSSNKLPSLPAVSVILSTYQQPDWLALVLEGYARQSFTDFELIVADDGSDDRTRSLLNTTAPQLPFSVKHVWHADDGFRKTIILNEAVRVSSGEYLVFSDGDCIPRADFLAKHVTLRERGEFLSGGYFKLPASVSSAIDVGSVRSQECFDFEWLRSRGLESGFKNHKLTAAGYWEKFLNRFTPTGATWNGMNSSGWREDILAVNGFDERMQYGGEDREMGERLVNLGVTGKQIRYSAICLHLHHERGYVTPEMIARNEAIRKDTRKQRLTHTPFGIDRAQDDS